MALSQGLGVIIAVPDRAKSLQVAGVPLAERLSRQFRLAGYGPVVMVHAHEVEELTPSCERWVCVPGDIVVEHVNGHWTPTSDLRFTRSWARRVCDGDSPPIEIPVLGRPSDSRAAEKLDWALSERVGRSQDPHFTRLWGRKLSRRISLRLAREGTSPNTVTLLALLFGLAAAGFLSTGIYAWMLVGSLLFVFSRLLDDCDGAVARLSVQPTQFGEIFDVASDILVHAAVFVGLGIGLNLWMPLVVLLVGAGLTTFLVLRYIHPLASTSRLARILERGASGDFAYILLFFTAIGKPEWFLWPAAIGSHAYWIALAGVVAYYRKALLQTAITLGGAALLALLIYRIGPAELAKEISALGWGFAAVIGQELLTLATAAVGWYYAIAPESRSMPFWRLGAYRLIAEAVNHLTPTATIGGEVFRARLAAPWIGGREAAASVTLAKLAETAGQVAFLAIGLLLLFPFVDALEDYRWMMAGLVVAGIIGIVLLIRLLNRGLFSMAHRKFPRWKWLEKHREDAETVDARIRDCVRNRPGDLVRSIAWHTGSYASRMIEVWIVLLFLGVTPTWPLVLGIEVLSVLIDGVLFFVPGKLGTQEGGKMLIFWAFGLPVEKGLALGLIRRGRELVWDFAGLFAQAIARW